MIKYLNDKKLLHINKDTDIICHLLYLLKKQSQFSKGLSSERVKLEVSQVRQSCNWFRLVDLPQMIRPSSNSSTSHYKVSDNL